MKKIEIAISAKATYLGDESDVEKKRFLWSYEIKVENKSDEIVQLLNRHWRITDMTGKVEEVRGPGVVGLQPIIKPGRHFTYNSFCQLNTPHGTMEGYYEMQSLDEVRFLAETPKIVLTTPPEASAGFRSRLH
jgi:ApaG protein